MAGTRKSLYISFVERYATTVISIISVVIVARLLSPEEIGIYSVGVAIIGITQVLRDFGVNQYLIVEADLTKARLQTAFGITILVSWSLAVLVFLASPWLAGFYDDVRIETVLSVLSINFLLLPFGNPVLALLRRDMEFGKLLQINVATSAVRETAAIAMAVTGFGYMSLVWASVASNVVTVLLASLYRPQAAWVRPSLREWRAVTGFGAFSAGSAIVSEIGVNAADLVIGRAMGFAQVGLYSRAAGLVNMFNQNIMMAVRWVSLPAFAKERREGSDIKPGYLRSVALITGIAWPFYGFLIFAAYPVIRVLFGTQWDAAVPLARLLALSGIVSAIWVLAAQVLLAYGQVRRILASEIIIQLCRVALIVIASFYGLQMVAASQVVTFAIGLVIYQYLLYSLLRMTLADLGRAISKSAGVTLCACIGPGLTYWLIPDNPETVLLALFCSAFSLFAGWILGIALLGHPLQEEMLAVLRYCRDRIGRRPASAN